MGTDNGAEIYGCNKSVYGIIGFNVLVNSYISASFCGSALTRYKSFWGSLLNRHVFDIQRNASPNMFRKFSPYFAG